MEFKNYVLRQISIIRANAENSAEDENAEQAERGSGEFNAVKAGNAWNMAGAGRRSSAESEIAAPYIKPCGNSPSAAANNCEIERLLSELDNLSGLNLPERTLFA